MSRFPATPMSPADIPENLLRVLNPGYWGGEVLGDDSGQPPEAPVSTKSRKIAADTIANAVRLTTRSLSLELWETGEVLEPGSAFMSEEREFGVLVLLRKEELTRTGSLIPYADMRRLKQLDPPAPPTGLHVDLGVRGLERSIQDRISGAGVLYTSGVHLGVISPDHTEGKRLFTISHSRVNRTISGQDIEVSTVWGSNVEPNPLPVGEVQHYSGRQWDAERLVRVNVLVANTLPGLMERPQS